MARQIILHVWCDPCAAKGETTEGVELPPLTLPEVGVKPRVAALCEVHRKELYDPLVELLREHGQIPDSNEAAPTVRGPRGPYGQAKGPDAQQCPLCDHVSPNRTALSSHVRSRHEKSLSELEGKEARYKCPECDKTSTRVQGIAAHRARAHGYRTSDHPDESPAIDLHAEDAVDTTGTTGVARAVANGQMVLGEDPEPDPPKKRGPGRPRKTTA